MPAEQASVEVRRKAAREVIDILHEIATLLVCQFRSPIFDILKLTFIEHTSRSPATFVLRLIDREWRKPRSISSTFTCSFNPSSKCTIMLDGVLVHNAIKLLSHIDSMQKVIQQLREEYPLSSVDGDAEA